MTRSLGIAVFNDHTLTAHDYVITEEYGSLAK
jgi:hypothetical protein